MNNNKLDFITKEVDNIADGLGMPIDAKIKNAVIALRYHDFPTCMSCEGHLGKNRGYPWPWVDIDYWETDLSLKIEEVKRKNLYYQKRAQQLLDSYYSNKEKTFLSLQICSIAYSNSFRIQSVDYSPKAHTDEFKRIIRDRKILSALQKEMNDFADYLLSI